MSKATPVHCNVFSLSESQSGRRAGGGGGEVFGSIRLRKAVIDFEALCRLRETQNRADCSELLWLRLKRKCSVTLTGPRRKCWWTELNKGEKRPNGGRPDWWGHDTNVFHWQEGKAPLLCHTHSMHSRKSNCSELAVGALSQPRSGEIHKHLV